MLTKLGCDSVIAVINQVIRSKIILPGVGSFDGNESNKRKGLFILKYRL